MNNQVSIYIPAYNAESTIREVIDSILNQSYKFDEIIVVNDSSNDKTVEKIKSFSELKIINNNTNKGLGFSRNVGIENCKNEIVAGIDADVVLDKFWLETILSYLKKDKIVMCGGNLKEKLTENKFNLWRSIYYKQNWGEQELLNPPFLYGCNTIQLKSIWKQVGGYNEELKTNGEDVEYCNRVRSSQDTNVFYSNKALCYHLQNDNIKTLSKRVWRYHSFGYKIKKPTIYRFIKLTIKQIKFFFQRSISSLFKLNFYFLYINSFILLDFIKLELMNVLKEK